MDAQVQKAQCRCGQVSLELIGRPMLRATCYCGSCQAAAKLLAELPDAPAIAGSDGGTGFVLYRKDRIGQATGLDRLQPHRLMPDSPTRRMVASCCNTPLFLDFTKGFWLSVYPGCLTRAEPPPTLRAHTAPFMARLLVSWAAMGFKAPKLGW